MRSAICSRTPTSLALKSFEFAAIGRQRSVAMTRTNMKADCNAGPLIPDLVVRWHIIFRVPDARSLADTLVDILAVVTLDLISFRAEKSANDQREL